MTTRAIKQWLLVASACGVAAIGAWRLRSGAAPVPAAPENQLVAGATLESGLVGGESRRYALPLESGRYVRLQVDQHGIDVVLRVLAPNGSRLVESDGLNGVWGPERVSFVSDQAGLYGLEVSPGSAKANPGRISVRLVEEGPASERDRLRVAGDWAGAEGRRLFMLGKREDYERAAASLSQALQTFRRAADTDGEAQVLFELGTTESMLGRRLDALKTYETALAVARQLPDRRHEADILGLRGYVYQELGEPRKALDDLSAALALWRALPDSMGEVGRTLNSLAGTYSQLGDRQHTLAYATLALRQARQLNNPYSLALGLQFYGNAMNWLDRPADALVALDEALALTRQLGQQRMQAAALYGVGASLRILERDGEAREKLNEALVLIRQQQDKVWEAWALLQLARTYRDPAEAPRKHQLLEEALRVSREAGYSSGEASALSMLGRLELDAGSLKASRRLLEDSLEIQERLWRLAPSADLQAGFFAGQFRSYETYADLLVRSQRAGLEPRGSALAFNLVEGARARGLQRQLLQAREEIRGDVPAELLTERRNLGRELLKREAARHGQQSIGAMRESESLAADLRRVEHRIAVESPRYAGLMLPSPITVEEVQTHLLDRDTLLLEYSLGEDRSYLWAVARSSQRVFELPPRREIEAACRRVVETLTARNSSIRFETPEERRERIRLADAGLLPASRALSQMVLGPVARLIPGKRLALVADGALQFVPFGALPEPAATGAYLPLAVGHEIVSLPSASVLRELRRQTASREPARKTLAVLADPILSPRDPRLEGVNALAMSASPPTLPSGVGARGRAIDAEAEWPRLPYARKEAEAILALVPPGERLGAFDLAASRETAESGALASYRIVHFATHANVDSEAPERSGIVLSMIDPQGRAEDGFLSLFEIYDLKLPADLVVLSGCRTALGKAIRGEGLIGLTRGFMFAGATRVVVSLWDVQDRATAELMERFYVHLLREGATPAAALREAQTEMWRSAQWSHPYNWAGFVLQGDWR